MNFNIVLSRIMKYDTRDSGNSIIYTNDSLTTVKDYNVGMDYMKNYKHRLNEGDYLFLQRKHRNDPKTVYYMTSKEEGVVQ